MSKQNLIDEITARVKIALGQAPGSDVEQNLRAVLQSVFAKLDLVTREEFDVQREVLLRTREKLEVLEKKISGLENQHSVDVS